MDSPGALQDAIDAWRQADLIGIDCESNSFFAYRERLCLLQVTVGETDWVVDPIALGDELKAINPLLEDPELITVLHSAEYDLMLLKQDLGAELRGLFDT